MNSFKKLFTILLVFVMVFTFTGCGNSKKEEVKEKDDKKENVKESIESYMGHSYSGKDPWGNDITINLMKLEDSKVTWTIDIAIGTGIKFSVQQTNEIKDNIIEFDAKGIAKDDPTNTFEYKGTISLELERLVIRYESGQISESSANGGSSSYQVGALEENKKTVTLVRDK